MTAAIVMGIPSYESLQLGVKCATHARQLMAKGAHGQSLLMELIHHKPPAGCLPWYAEYMRDLVCIITMQLLVSGGRGARVHHHHVSCW